MPSCPRCGHENGAGARFCTDCGEALGAGCPSCGAAVAGSQRFCGNCGQALTVAERPAAGGELLGDPDAYTPPHLASRILAQRHALRGERKQVTVLFCDVADSTRIAERVGPEGMHALLSDFFDTALACVHRVEGTVNQFLGDGFMAIFGAPLAYEDHAARAALAATAIRDAVAARRAEAPVDGWADLHVRIGLNSGPVVVGAIGDDLRMDYTASGDITHVAARLEALAEPDEILCGEATVAAAHDAIAVEPLAPAEVKGKAQPIARYRLQRANELTVRTIGAGGTFVGRDAELATLARALGLATSGKGGRVEIEGEPGVGKSRLVAEFVRGLGDRAGAVVAHCITYGQQAPNVPVVDLVRGLAGLDSADDDDAAEAALARLLGHEGTEEADALGALIGLPASIGRTAAIDPATARGRSTQGLVKLAAAACAERPLVAVVEDLHWADASSLDFIAALTAAAEDMPLLLVVTYRPGSEPAWGAGSRLDRLYLAPLPEGDASRLVAALGAGASMSDARKAAIVARGEGNPFFLEELVRTVGPDSTEIPGDVLDVLAARIDRLAADEKDLLRTAAVIGRRFPRALLEAIAAPASDIVAALNRLVNFGFVEPLGGGTFTFAHALTQDVAYAGMLKNDAAGLHTAVAEELARGARGAEAVCEDVARHHLQGRTPARAIPFLETAIGKAIRGHALEEALTFFEDALRLLEAEPEDDANRARRVALLLQMFPVFHWTHRNQAYAALIERYRPVADALGDSPLRGAFLAHRGHRLWIAGRFVEAVPVLDDAAAICEAHGDHANAAHAEFMLSWGNLWLGDFERAYRHGPAGLAHLEQVPVPMLETYIHCGLLLADVFRGRWTSAVDHGRRARQVGVDHADDGLASFGGAFKSFALTSSGQAREGLAAAQQALADAPTDYFRGWAAAYMAVAMCRLGQAADALPIAEQAVGFARASHHIAGWIFIAPLLVEARLRCGKLDEAREAGESLRAESVSLGVPLMAALSALLLGEIALAGGSAADALEHFRQSESENATLGADDGRCQARFGEGRALAALGERGAAREALEDALAGFERLGTRGLPDAVHGALASL